MKIGILGAGLSGITLAYLLQEDENVSVIDLLEKQKSPGGLCRSYSFAGIECDVGPHIIFSKNKNVLDLMVGLLGDNVHKLRRSNKIFHDGRFIKYPFENELSALSEPERDYCLNAFLNNPYESYVPESMLGFFLATFGEGITNLYLRPYNEKIWKFDPAFMDTQMADRIPKPPREDIIKSARGDATDGYLHQLHFYYPKHGGVQALLDGFLSHLGSKVSIQTEREVGLIVKEKNGWEVRMDDGTIGRYDRLVSTIPVSDMIPMLRPEAPVGVCEAAANLRFNSIAICLVHVAHDNLGDNFAVMVPDKSILFHRISKLDFLLPEESRDGTTRFMVEVTYRNGDQISQLSDEELLARIKGDLLRLKFVDGPGDFLRTSIIRQKHAYVIYDLHHRKNMNAVRAFCEGTLGMTLHGRFGEFDYLNMDAVVERSLKHAAEILS